MNTVITPEGKAGQLRIGLCGHARASVVTVDGEHRLYVDGVYTRSPKTGPEAKHAAYVAAGVRRTGETLH